MTVAGGRGAGWRDFLRSHPFELEDAPWLPRAWRRYMTDYLRVLFERTRLYDKALPVLADAFERSGASRLLDLGSGAGGPAVRMAALLEERLGRPVPLTLTDRFPPVPAPVLRDGVRYHPEPVDAASVRASLSGFRTLFTAFHHFPSASARRLLADAVAKRDGIAVFEVTSATPRMFLLMLPTPLLVLLLAPFVRPRSAGRLLFTYPLPAIPLLSLWDGLVSNLRSYPRAELLALASELPEYDWRAGTVPGRVPVRYLVGWPGSAEARRP